MQDADQIDHRVTAGQEPCQHRRIAHPGLDHIDCGQGNEVLGTLATSRGDQHSVPLFRKHANDVAADKAATSDNTNFCHSFTREERPPENSPESCDFTAPRPPSAQASCPNSAAPE